MIAEKLTEQSTAVKPLAMILHASGTNRDQDVAQALDLAGARAEIVHLNAFRRGERSLAAADMLILPGGFSYGDALGAGRLFALDLQTYLLEALQAFVESGKPVIGICNGFQALIKAGLLPGWPEKPHAASLVANASGHFACRWVTLAAPQETVCRWTAGLTPFTCPVAHGEGRFVLRDDADLDRLRANGQIALTYQDGTNPNGSLADIAGICNPAGNVLGLMPHPEDHVHPWQHPGYDRRKEREGAAGVDPARNPPSGLPLFQAGLAFLAKKGF